MTVIEGRLALAPQSGTETGTLHVSIQPTLESVSEECLREITAEGHFFASASWYRMLEQLDLGALAGGQVERQFVIVSSNGRPVAICPLIRASGRKLYCLYSFQRYYFESWIEVARRMRPELTRKLNRAYKFVKCYRKVLEWMNCSLDDFLIVSSPLSPRAQVPMAPMSPKRREQVVDHLLVALKGYAAQQGRPLWFLSVEGENGALPQSLESAGFQSTFLAYDTRIDLSHCSSFDDYVESFASKCRRKSIRRECRRIANSGITFRYVDDFSDYAAEFSRLYLETSSRYNSSHVNFDPGFWTTLARSQGSNAEALLAEHNGRLVGFSVLLKNETRRELINYEGGRLYDAALERVPFYFELVFYEPIRRAIELGYHTLWLGALAYEQKVGRGVLKTPLFSHFWFPRLRDRLMLRRFLQEFGTSSRGEMDRWFDEGRCAHEQKEAAAER